MVAFTFTALFVLLGLLWIAPAKTVSELLSTAGAEGLATSGADTAFGFRGRSLSAGQCGSCHARHLEEWRRSFHARSVTSDNFMRAFSQYLDSLGTERRAEPRSSLACLSCHAPLVEKAGPEVVRQVTNLLAAKETEKLDGFEVGCAACHLDESGRFSGPIGKPRENPFHASMYSASYKDSSFCATCHTWVSSAVPCSDVHTDWRKSRAARRGTTCQSCHMAESTGAAATAGPERKIHSHVFPGGRSSAMLQQALTLGVKAAFRKDRLEVTAVVRNLVPHRVPDG